MSFEASVQWWEDWQLRLLVLASLFFQYFLFAAAIVRKLRVPHWFRALIWLAYQGGDVVAIYALATLFNQHKEEALARYPAASAHLDTLWAPVLLLHLGGQDGITAYSIEDNENWRRYLWCVRLVQCSGHICRYIHDHLLCGRFRVEKLAIYTVIILGKKNGRDGPYQNTARMCS
jgi:hypothetical protein